MNCLEYPPQLGALCPYIYQLWVPEPPPGTAEYALWKLEVRFIHFGSPGPLPKARHPAGSSHSWNSCGKHGGLGSPAFTALLLSYLMRTAHCYRRGESFWIAFLPFSSLGFNLWNMNQISSCIQHSALRARSPFFLLYWRHWPTGGLPLDTREPVSAASLPEGPSPGGFSRWDQSLPESWVLLSVPEAVMKRDKKMPQGRALHRNDTQQSVCSSRENRIHRCE